MNQNGTLEKNAKKNPTQKNALLEELWNKKDMTCRK